MRSIPAYAGDPCITRVFSRPCGVYPRLRGGSDCITAAEASGEGLSPPTRGIPPSVAGGNQ